MATVQEVAYVAGLFDGEGCVRLETKISQRRAFRRAQPVVKIQMTEAEPLRFVQEAFGGKLSDPREWEHPDGSPRRPLYRWLLGTRDGVSEFVRAIKPYSVNKHRQLEVLGNYLDNSVKGVVDQDLANVVNQQLTALKGPSPQGAVFDTETLGLDPIHLPLLSCTILPNADESSVFSIAKTDFESEHEMVVNVRDTLESYPYTLGWNSSRFDIEYIDTRLALYGERMMFLGSHTDVDVEFDRKFNNKKRTSLVNAANQLKVTDEEVHKTPINWPIWHAADAGDKEAMNYVTTHAQMDVVLTKRIWNAIQ